MTVKLPLDTGPECPVIGCTARPWNGIPHPPRMKCRGYGTWDVRCMANWLSIDSEDSGTYAEYLADAAKVDR